VSSSASSICIHSVPQREHSSLLQAGRPWTTREQSCTAESGLSRPVLVSPLLTRILNKQGVCMRREFDVAFRKTVSWSIAWRCSWNVVLLAPGCVLVPIQGARRRHAGAASTISRSRESFGKQKKKSFTRGPPLVLPKLSYARLRASRNFSCDTISRRKSERLLFHFLTRLVPVVAALIIFFVLVMQMCPCSDSDPSHLIFSLGVGHQR
jgi:hypothetical protein